MSAIVDFLSTAGAFYLATTEDNQPRVRPFGAALDYRGRVYLCTNNTKAVFAQLRANPKVEIAACGTDGAWIRITARAVLDNSAEARAAMLETHPGLRRMYSPEDGLFEVFYLAEGSATIYRRGAEPELLSF